MLVASVYAFVSNFTSSSIAPVLQLWPAAYPQEPKDFSQLAYIVAVSNHTPSPGANYLPILDIPLTVLHLQVHVLLLGTSNMWWVPLSNWMGRRPVLLIATLLMTLCSVWCAQAKTFDSLIAARIFQAAGGGAAETVAPALIGELYFIHERGRAMVSPHPPRLTLELPAAAEGLTNNARPCTPSSSARALSLVALPEVTSDSATAGPWCSG